VLSCGQTWKPFRHFISSSVSSIFVLGLHISLWLGNTAGFALPLICSRLSRCTRLLQRLLQYVYRCTLSACCLFWVCPATVLCSVICLILYAVMTVVSRLYRWPGHNMLSRQQHLTVDVFSELDRPMGMKLRSLNSTSNSTSLWSPLALLEPVHWY
jgi:hypothetical protein